MVGFLSPFILNRQCSSTGSTSHSTVCSHRSLGQHFNIGCASKDPAVNPASCSNCIGLRIAYELARGGGHELMLAFVADRLAMLSRPLALDQFFNSFQRYSFSRSSTCQASSQTVILSSSSTYLLGRECFHRAIVWIRSILAVLWIQSILAIVWIRSSCFSLYSLSLHNILFRRCLEGLMVFSFFKSFCRDNHALQHDLLCSLEGS